MPYIGNSPKNNVRSRYYYTATSGQTVFSGADDNGHTLAYQDGSYVDVYLNGILLEDTTDYTALTKTSITLTSGATTDDIVEIVAYGIFSVADTVSAKDGGGFGGNITAPKYLTTSTKIETAILRINDQTLSTNTTIASDENASCAGPLTIDTNTTLTIDGNLTVV